MKTLISRLAVTSAIGLAATSADAEIDLDNPEQNVSYSLGTLVAGQLANDFDNLNLEAFVEGFNAAYLGQKTLVNQKEAVAAVQDYQRKIAASKFEGALTNSEAYLSENAKNDGVQVALARPGQELRAPAIWGGPELPKGPFSQLGTASCYIGAWRLMPRCAARAREPS